MRAAGPAGTAAGKEAAAGLRRGGGAGTGGRRRQREWARRHLSGQHARPCGERCFRGSMAGFGARALFQAILSVIAVKIQLSSPSGVRRSDRCPGIRSTISDGTSDSGEEQQKRSAWAASAG